MASSGILVGDSVHLTGSSHFADANVGTAKSVSVDGIAATGLDAGNYRISNSSAGTKADITPATLTYLASPMTVPGGQTPTDPTGVVTGWVGDDTLATASTGTLTWNNPVTALTPAGRYAITGTGLTAANYLFVQAPGNATALKLTTNRAPGSSTAPDVAVISGAQLQQLNQSPVENQAACVQGTASFAASCSAGKLSLAPYLRIVDGGVRMP